MIKVVMLDLDGTVYCGDKLIDGADAAIQHMRNSGIKVFFCTNNSTKSPFEISKKLNRLGIFCAESEIISSGGLAVQYAIDNRLKNVYFSGTEDIEKLLIDGGVGLVDESRCDNLIIAFDVDFTYRKLIKAVRAALNSQTIIVCN